MDIDFKYTLFRGTEGKNMEGQQTLAAGCACSTPLKAWIESTGRGMSPDGVRGNCYRSCVGLIDTSVCVREHSMSYLNGFNCVGQLVNTCPN